MDTNPIQYTSRDFDSINNDINKDAQLKDKPNWFKRLIAGIGDVFSMWINAAANDLYLRTAFTRQAVSDLCGIIGYTLLPQTTSGGVLLFYVDTSLGGAIFPFTVAAVNLRAQSQGSLNLSSKTFEGRASKTFSLVQDNFTTNYAVNNQLTVTYDFGYTGHKVRVSTNGTLPSPLQADVDYYVIYISATQIALAKSLADAYVGNQIALLSDGTGTQTLTLYSADVSAYQQDSLTDPVSLGQSDGVTEFQEFLIPDQLILKDTLVITINSVTWTMVSDFTDSISTSKHFKLVPLSENQFSIRFGNGIYGMIPPANFDIMGLYAMGGGINSNLKVVGNINSYAGNDSHIVGVSNPGEFTGGDDQQSITSAKNLAPISLKTHDRFINMPDAQSLVLGYGGIAICKVNRLKYGVLSCQIVMVANGGGNPTPTIEAAIQQYLIDRTILSCIDVRCEDSLITPVSLTTGMKVLIGYSYTNLEPYFRLAYKLLLSETGTEIKAIYMNSGIVATVSAINAYFAENFGPADYTQIKTFMDNLIPRQHEDTLTSATMIQFIENFLTGCDYVTIGLASPTLPLIMADNQITTVGTLTLSEIV